MVGRNSAEYLTTLPFVRMLSGPMDYTPGIFDIDYSTAKADKGRIEWNGPNAECCIKTTLARQIANWVIIYSPLQMAADLIENYEGHPAFRFFRDFDADCDWSKALQERSATISSLQDGPKTDTFSGQERTRRQGRSCRSSTSSNPE